MRTSKWQWVAPDRALVATTSCALKRAGHSEGGHMARIFTERVRANRTNVKMLDFDGSSSSDDHDHRSAKIGAGGGNGRT